MSAQQQLEYVQGQSQSQRVAIRNQGIVVPARTGTTNVAVVQWQSDVTTIGIGFQKGLDWIEQVRSDELGTEVRIRAPGIYAIEWGFFINGQDPPLNPILGISADVEASGLVSLPDFAIVGMLDVFPTALPLGTQMGGKMTTELEVTQEAARKVVGGVQGTIVRFHAATADEGPAVGPGGSLQQEPCYYQITRTGNSYAP
jgi:hypothetical protein